MPGALSVALPHDSPLRFRAASVTGFAPATSLQRQQRHLRCRAIRGRTPRLALRLKCECFQNRPGSSRRAARSTRCCALSADDRWSGLVTVSAGNHAQARRVWALAKSALPCVVVIADQGAPALQLDAVRGYGTPRSCCMSDDFARPVRLRLAEVRAHTRPHLSNRRHDPVVLAGAAPRTGRDLLENAREVVVIVPGWEAGASWEAASRPGQGLGSARRHPSWTSSSSGPRCSAPPLAPVSRSRPLAATRSPTYDPPSSARCSR